MCPLRLSVRTSGFHPEKRSSILLGVAISLLIFNQYYIFNTIDPVDFLDCNILCASPALIKSNS